MAIFNSHRMDASVYMNKEEEAHIYYFFFSQ